MSEKIKKFVSCRDVRQILSDLLSQAKFCDCEIIICRRGHPQAKIVGISKKEKSELISEIKKNGLESNKKGDQKL